MSAFETLVRDVRGCTACDGVCHAHVLGAGNGPLNASVAFVAEAVGRRGGAVTGVPMTRDESGRRFAAFLTLARLRREDVFVTNAVLCNPLDAAGRNRPPSAREIARCRPFLERTLDAVRAPVVITLGRVALDALGVIAPHQGQLERDVASSLKWCDRTLVPMYHPSRQSTLHRSQSQQEDDWRRLGDLLSAGRSPDVRHRQPGGY